MKEKLKSVKVKLEFSPDKIFSVGNIFLLDSKKIYFQFEASFLEQHSKLYLSPFKLKKQLEPQIPKSAEADLFHGLFGVFADSLPDGWGLLLLSRAMRKIGLSFERSSGLDFLGVVGRRGMGALTYEPEADLIKDSEATIDLTRISIAVDEILEGKSEDVLAELLQIGGSPAGARPKILVGVKTDGKHLAQQEMISGSLSIPDGFEHWLVKFRGRGEAEESTLIEFIYMKLAQDLGLKTEPCSLFKDRNGHVWFGTRRFDRASGGRRVHVHSLAGLVHADYRLPSLDYETFLQVTLALTKSQEDLMLAFRQMVFNVCFHNRDDHAKNFAYLLSEDGTWCLSPAYDLTFSYGPGGEHSMAIAGEGRSPNRKSMLSVAEKVGISATAAHAIFDEFASGFDSALDLFRQYGIKNHPLESIVRIC
ncbi:MAG: type II toxin-antitoxin system HipA family toxin [Oligoflexales bacterium]|nr:type II toxin-antitoxin system HipA family toxin [Oligoflexales bacterium]